MDSKTSAAAPASAPETAREGETVHGVLLREAAGFLPGVVFAPKSRAALKRLVDAGDARAATPDEVELARPSIRILEA